MSTSPWIPADESELKKQWTPVSENKTQMKAAPGMFTMPWLKEKFFNAADVATNAMPAAGGIAGGLLGASGGSAVPGAGTVAGGVTGAAIGGGGGEALRQLTRRALGFEDAPQTSGDAALGIGKEGLKQGAYEAGGQVLRAGGHALAPKMAEAAVAPGKRLLKSIPESVDIGRTVLDESTGYKPGTIAKELSGKIADKSTQLDTVMANASNHGTVVPLTPARNLVSDELTSAVDKNAAPYVKDITKLKDQLYNQIDQTGNPVAQIPAWIDPEKARALKQGIDLQIGSWNKESQSAIAPLQERVRGAIAGQIHNAVPESAPLDNALTNLIPAKDAAWNTSFNPGLTKNLFERFARPTGAALSTIYAADKGYDKGGIAGGAAGATAGLALPLFLSSPTGMMLGARMLNSNVGPGLFRVGAPLIEGEMGRNHKRK